MRLWMFGSRPGGGERDMDCVYMYMRNRFGFKSCVNYISCYYQEDDDTIHFHITHRHILLHY